MKERLVDLDECPVVKASFSCSEEDPCTVTLGDMHASIKRLAHFLVAHNLWNLSDTDYRVLCHTSSFFLNDGAHTKDAIDESLGAFYSLLNSTSFQNQPGLTVRFIGDVFADRGPNDWLTLKIFEKMASAGIDFRLIFGNHDLEFVRYLENKVKPINKKNMIKYEIQMRSVVALDKLIRLEAITLQDVFSLYENIVVPRWEFWGYDFSKQQPIGSLFVHAFALPQHFFEGASFFISSERNDSSIQTRDDLAQRIDQTNQTFRDHANQYELISHLYPKNLAHSDNPPHSWAFFCTWSRGEWILTREGQKELEKALGFLRRLGLIVWIGHLGAGDNHKNHKVVTDHTALYRVLDTDTGKTDEDSYQTGLIYLALSGDEHIPQVETGYTYLSSQSNLDQLEKHGEFGHLERMGLESALLESALLESQLSPLSNKFSRFPVRQETIAHAVNTYIAEVRKLIQTEGAFDSFIQKTNVLSTCLSTDRDDLSKRARIWKAVVVNALLMLLAVITVGLAGFVFSERKKKTGCPWYYGQTDSADLFFPIRQRLTNAAEHSFRPAPIASL
jgi:hypothetical protein